jgi:spermidine synthase
MKPWVELERTTLPGGEVMSLHRRDEEFVIRVNGVELMNSRAHGSEDALAVLACEAISSPSAPRVLIGGLGMGFTLKAALGRLPDEAEVTVAELVPAVIEWNRGPLAHLTQPAMDDPRTRLHVGDVRAVLESAREAWDAILLDVDNGPEGLTQSSNDALYGRDGLGAIGQALKPNGVLAVWSVSLDPAFTRRLMKAGFSVTTHPVHASGRRGRRHLIWLARRR